MKCKLFLCAALGLGGIANGEEAQVLKCDLEVGKVYTMSQTVETDMNMKNPMTNEAMHVSSSTSIEYSAGVEADPKGEKMTVTVKGYAMKSKAAGVEMEYDSADESTHTGAMAQMMKGIVGMQSGAIFDAKGNVIETFKGESAADSQQLGMTGEHLVDAIGQSFKMFPDQALKVGDTWDVDTQMSLGGVSEDPMSVNTSYKLEGYEEVEGNTHAKISFTAEMDGKVNMGGMAMTLKSDKFQGTILHDTALNVARKLTSEMEMMISVPEGSPMGAGGLGSIPYTVQMNQELKSVE